MREIFTFTIFLLLMACQTEEPFQEEVVDRPSKVFDVGSYEMRGQEGRIAFFDAPFIAGEGQKYMWHFWGEEDELKGDVKVKATHQNTGEEQTVVAAPGVAGPNNGADAHLPSTISLPESGMWQLDAFIGGELFGSVNVEVSE